MNLHLVLFFTRGVSLRTWGMMGMLDREIAIYRRLVRNGFDVSFVTYGGADDLEYSERLGPIRILCNEDALPPAEYERRLMAIHGRVLSGAHVVKTNQTYGAELALETAKHLSIPLVARCGYMWSFNAGREHGLDSPAAVEARRVEEKVFSEADGVVVTTEAMHRDLLQRIPHTHGKVRVIPNYVETERFKPLDLDKDLASLIFVGRIAPEKNLDSLLEAIRPLDVKLTLIGEGRLRPDLQKKFADLDSRLSWEGTVRNSELPAQLNRAGIFVLPSLYEGHPKSLIEAMSCRMPVIGADSPGIREIVRHRENGLLCGTGPEGIRTAIMEVLSHTDLSERIGISARKYVLENYSLDRIAELELSLLREVTGR
jgi:glycosyltransferase involved in cell wall biosynthesis